MFVCDKRKPSRQYKERNLICDTWWNIMPHLLTKLVKMRLKMKNSTMTSGITRMLHLLIYRTMSTGVYTMQLAQFIFIQWTDNSGSKVLFSVTETEKEQLWKSVEREQHLKVIYWQSLYRKMTVHAPSSYVFHKWLCKCNMWSRGKYFIVHSTMFCPEHMRHDVNNTSDHVKINYSGEKRSHVLHV